MKTSQDKRSHILRRFLLSYLTILIIPILLSSWVYFSWLSTINEKAVNDNINDLNNIKYYIDGQLREINSVTTNLAENPLVTDLLFIDNNLESSPDIYKVYTADLNLGNEYIHTSLVSDYFIFYRDSDVVISPRGTSINHNFYYGDSFQFMDARWRDFALFLFSSYHQKEVLPLTTLLIDTVEIKGIPYIQSLPNTYPLVSKAVIFALLDPLEFNIFFSNINIGKTGYTYVADAEGSIIYSIPENLDQSKHIAKPSESVEGSDTMMINGKQMIVTWVESEYNDWQYVAALPITQASNEVNRARITIIMVLLISLLGGGVVAYLFAMRNAGPLRHVMDMIGELGSDDTKGNNELIHLEHGIEHLLDNNTSLKRDNTDLRQTIRQHYNLLYNSFMERLFKEGFEQSEDIDEFTKQLDINLSGYRYMAGIIELGGFSDVPDAQQLMEMDLTRDVAKDELKKIFGSSVLLINSTRGIDMLILIDRDHINEYRNWVDLCFIDLSEMLLNKHSIPIYCTAGSLCQHLSEVHSSWSQAMRIITMKDLYTQSPYTAYHHIENLEADVYYPLTLEERLINICISGNITEAKNILSSIFDDTLKGGAVTPVMAAHLCDELLGTIVKLKYQTGQNNAIYSILTTYNEINGVDEKFKFIQKTLIDECRNAGNLKDKENDELRIVMCNFIEKNYDNSNLQISDLASKYNLSVSFLYKFFKKNMGTTFAEYLESIRIDHAAYLLKDTDTMIKEIAEMCGYNSGHVFRRAFRRVKGVLPTDYRNR